MLVVGWALVLSSLLVWFMVNMDRGVAQIASILMLVVAGLITLAGLVGHKWNACANTHQND